MVLSVSSLDAEAQLWQSSPSWGAQEGISRQHHCPGLDLCPGTTRWAGGLGDSSRAQAVSGHLLDIVVPGQLEPSLGWPRTREEPHRGLQGAPQGSDMSGILWFTVTAVEWARSPILALSEAERNTRGAWVIPGSPEVYLLTSSGEGLLCCPGAPRQ